jgi:hypothetical protein
LDADRRVCPAGWASRYFFRTIVNFRRHHRSWWWSPFPRCCRIFLTCCNELTFIVLRVLCYKVTILIVCSIGKIYIYVLWDISMPKTNLHLLSSCKKPRNLPTQIWWTWVQGAFFLKSNKLF